MSKGEIALVPSARDTCFNAPAWRGEGRRLQKTSVPLGLVEGFGAGGEAVGSVQGDGRASGRGRLDLLSLCSGAEVARTHQPCLEAIT